MRLGSLNVGNAQAVEISLELDPSFDVRKALVMDEL